MLLRMAEHGSWRVGARPYGNVSVKIKNGYVISGCHLSKRLAMHAAYMNSRAVIGCMLLE